MPKINRKLFQRVYDHVVAHPEEHDQADWGGSGGCGTTHCVGGWALHFHRPDQDLWETANEVTGLRLASLAEGAEKLLGLNELEAWRLFYDTENAEAVELCRRYATGGRKSADRYIRKIEAEEGE